MNARKRIALQSFITILALFDIKNFSRATIIQIKNFFEKVIVFVDILELSIVLLRWSFIFKISTTEQTIVSFHVLMFEQKINQKDNILLNFKSRKTLRSQNIKADKELFTNCIHQKELPFNQLRINIFIQVWQLNFQKE